MKWPPVLTLKWTSLEEAEGIAAASTIEVCLLDRHVTGLPNHLYPVGKRLEAALTCIYALPVLRWTFAELCPLPVSCSIRLIDLR
jgi:hypothetical protein